MSDLTVAELSTRIKELAKVLPPGEKADLVAESVVLLENDAKFFQASHPGHEPIIRNVKLPALPDLRVEPEVYRFTVSLVEICLSAGIVMVDAANARSNL